MNNHSRHDDDGSDEIRDVFYDASGMARDKLRRAAATILWPGVARDGTTFRDEDVGDVIQDSYFAVVDARAGGREILNLVGYAIGVVRNKAHDRVRRVRDGERWQCSLDAPLHDARGAATLADLLGERSRIHGSAQADPHDSVADSDGLQRILAHARIVLAKRPLALQALETLVSCDSDARWALDMIQAETQCGRPAAKMRLQEARDAIRATYRP